MSDNNCKPVNHRLAADKMVSHRLKGFADIEQTPSAMKAACRCRVALLEIDTRVSRDGQIYVYHDPLWGTHACPADTKRIAHVDSQYLDLVRYRNGEPLLTFRDALGMFEQRLIETQQLCVDIKDYGFEAEHLESVRDYNLESNVCFISWIPRTLLELYRLGSSSPLILSFYSLFGRGFLGKAFSKVLENQRWIFSLQVGLGKNRALDESHHFTHGFVHVLYCRELPPPLVDILAGSGGGICIKTGLLNEELIRYCRRQGLQIWVYTTATGEEYLKYALNPDLNHVFCDNTPAVLKRLMKTEV